MPSLRSKTALHTALIAALASVTGGCQAPLAEDDTWLAYPEVEGRHASIVFNTPALQPIAPHTTYGGWASQLPWYASRNDAPLATFDGFQSDTIDRIVNITYDHQITTGNQARDRFHSLTIRQSTLQTVR